MLQSTLVLRTHTIEHVLMSFAYIDEFQQHKLMYWDAMRECCAKCNESEYREYRCQ